VRREASRLNTDKIYMPTHAVADTPQESLTSIVQSGRLRGLAIRSRTLPISDAVPPPSIRSKETCGVSASVSESRTHVLVGGGAAGASEVGWQVVNLSYHCKVMLLLGEWRHTILHTTLTMFNLGPR
jgi:hypothetical protein